MDHVVTATIARHGRRSDRLARLPELLHVLGGVYEGLLTNRNAVNTPPQRRSFEAR